MVDIGHGHLFRSGDGHLFDYLYGSFKRDLQLHAAQ